MKKLKKRFIIPAVVFILGMCALIGAIYVVGEGQEQQNRTKAKLNAMTYMERINGELIIIYFSTIIYYKFVTDFLTLCIMLHIVQCNVFIFYITSKNV